MSSWWTDISQAEISLCLEKAGSGSAFDKAHMGSVCMVIPGKENKQDRMYSIMLTKTWIVHAGVHIGLFAYSPDSVFPFPHLWASMVPEQLGELFESGGQICMGGGQCEGARGGGMRAERVLLSGTTKERG